MMGWLSRSTKAKQAGPLTSIPVGPLRSITIDRS
jgi:hypothetical protein